MSRLDPLSAALVAMVELLDRELTRADEASDRGDLAGLRTWVRRQAGEDDPREESDDDDPDLAS
jgi:hypothetical protein